MPTNSPEERVAILLAVRARSSWSEGYTPPKGKFAGQPNGYIKYENRNNQPVDPYSGKTLSNAQAHFSLKSNLKY
jgi:hypothetical protein